MALQVWLPLVSDLRNQGLAQSASFGTTTAFATNGKLGAKSLYSNVKKTATFTELTNVTNFSFAYWIKIDSSVTIQNYADIIGLQCIVGNTTAIIRDEFTNTAGRHNIIMGKDPTVGDDTNTYYNTRAESIGAKDIWTHYVIVKDNTNTYVYTNGVLTNTCVNSDFENSPQKLTGLIYLGNTSSTAAQVNDLRIYDHCLTPEEAKRIAQGLILHYPLNRNGWGQENLLKNSANMQTIDNSVLWSVAANCSITNGVARIAGDGGWRAVGCFEGLKLADYKGKTVTVSVDIKAETTGATYRPMVEFRTTESAFSEIRKWRYKTINLNGQRSNIPDTGWQRYSLSFTLDTGVFTNYDNNEMNVEPDWANGYWGIRIYNHSNIYYNMKNIKLEEGSIATPWCPNSSDALATTMGLNGTTEYDISGFCNNGTRTGTFSWTSDTPKYCVSTQFTRGSSSLQMINPSFITEGTAAMWVKIDTIGSSGWLPCAGQSDHHYFCATSDGTGNFYNQNIGSNTIKYYCDGVQVTAPTNLKTGWHHIVITGINLSSWTILFLNGYGSQGSTSWNSSCKYADFRIYATALSADDVKSLYQNCATIGPDGTIYGEIR